MDQITAPILEAALLKGCASFAPDELAYLALTSKPEGPIRDRLAWALHTGVPGVIAAREWASPLSRARTDLAVLDATTHAPLGLVELKAAYTFNFADENMPSVEKYTRRVEVDLEKARAVGAGRCPVFALLLLTSPSGPSEQPSSVVKYSPEITRSLQGQTALNSQRPHAESPVSASARSAPSQTARSPLAPRSGSQPRSSTS